MKRLLLTLIAFVVCSCSKNIEPSPIDRDNNSSTISVDDISVSAQQAAYIANTFFNKKVNPTTRNNIQQQEIESIYPINNEIGNPLIYVINFKNKGFALVSSTKNYMPILAYSDKSNFDYDNAIKHLGISKWIDETLHNIKNTDNLTTSEKFKIRNQWIDYEKQDERNTLRSTTKTYDSAGDSFHNRLSTIREENPGYNFYSLSRVDASMFPSQAIYDEICNLASNYNSPAEYTIVGIKNNYRETKIGPLLSTKWDQEREYNKLIPNEYPAGCVAIAMAQIMRFHEHPKRYNWSNMPYTLPTRETQELIYHIGQAVNMKYGVNGSSSSIYKAQDAFNNNFDYSASIKDHNYLNVLQELKAYNRPVYMRGAYTNPSPDEGHAWVCDGAWETYTSVNTIVEFMFGTDGNYYFSDDGNFFPESGYDLLFFSMNWGWGGKSDGWYMHNNSSNPHNTDIDYSHNRKDMFISIR